MLAPIALRRRWRLVRGAIISLGVYQLIGLAVLPASAANLGANKFDLMMQYTEYYAPTGVDSDAFHKIRRAMARKAIADARDAGFTFLRVAVTGYEPNKFDVPHNDLRLWINDPPAFWVDLDQMFDDLDHAHVQLVPTFVWNITQFPSLAHETVGMLVRDPRSRSRALLVKFIQEFVLRVKDRSTVLFYELTNEMNLLADLDQRGRCQNMATCVWDNFTTGEMTEFSRDIASRIKSFDRTRLVTSGYSIPRPAAMHLMRQAEFAPAGADWTRDTPTEFQEYLIAVHKPFDVISMHIYSRDVGERFGRAPGQEYKIVADAAAASETAEKPLFIGEFSGDEPLAFLDHLFDEVLRTNVQYTAIWAWEYYQNSTVKMVAGNVEPGFSDDVIALLVGFERASNPKSAISRSNGLPRVVLTWPLPCAVIDRPIDLTAVASDGWHRVRSVEFLVDRKPVGVVSVPPYVMHFDPSGLGARTARIEARAFTASGSSAGFSIDARLNAAIPPCSVSP
jgi:hypothetical protein